MQSIFKSFICAFMLVAFTGAGMQASAKTKTAVITVQTSAVCGSCKARIESALKGTEGVLEANLNLETKKVKVKYNPDKLSENQVRLAITNAGYDADDMKADKTAYSKLPGCCQGGGAKCSHAKE